MWTINDFLAYEMLSGWMTQGKLMYSICMEDTKSFTLKYGRMNYWFNYYRRFLDMDYTYRRSRYGFRKNIIESEEATIRLIDQQIWDKVGDHLYKYL